MTTNLTTVPPELERLAAAQRGCVTTAQAARLGIGRFPLAGLVRSGLLLHPMRGLYLVRGDDLDADDAHRRLAHGATLLYPDGVLTGVSSVLAHDVPVWGVNLARPELLRPIQRATGTRGIRVRPMRGGATTTPLGPASPLAQSLVQLGIDHGLVQAVVSADAALHVGLVSTAELEHEAGLVSRWPHAGRIASLLSFVDGRSESVGESRCRVELVMDGIEVEPQVAIADGGGVFARVDMLVKGTKVVVEFDGRVKYAAGDPQVLWAEKRREDRLRALGYVIVRVVWSDLDVPGRVARRVRQALARAA